MILTKYTEFSNNKKNKKKNIQKARQILNLKCQLFKEIISLAIGRRVTALRSAWISRLYREEKYAL